MLPKIFLGQQFFRIKAGFSIKEKTSDGKQQLTMGDVYFDKNSRKIIYNLTFPAKETWVTTDSLIYKIVNDSLQSTQKITQIIDFSIFNLALNGNLNNYGLDNSVYKITETKKEEGMVITTWKPKFLLRSNFGTIAMSHKEGNLFGLVFFNPDDAIISKQFFKNYITVSGLRFPSEIVQIFYKEKEENYKVTTFRNIVVNDFKEDAIYNYSIPK